jgi:hypothetical protein
MAATSRTLLAEVGSKVPPKTIRYLVAAGMLGSIVQHDEPAAVTLWAKYENLLPIGDDLLLRLLVTRARNGGSPPGDAGLAARASF